MNCEDACHLMDDYRQNLLSRRERQRLERHLTVCPACAGELRQRPAFDRKIERALAASVQPLHLSAATSARLVQAAQGSVRWGMWSRRATGAAQVMAAAGAVALLVVGLLVTIGQVSLLVEWLEPSPKVVSQPLLSLTRSDILIEPQDLAPGEAFTTTIFFHSNYSQPVDAVRFKLDIRGPTGSYAFMLALQGPFPAQGVSVLRVTPDMLALPCREQYHIAPADIMRVPGVYTMRATLLSPVVMPEQ